MMNMNIEVGVDSIPFMTEMAKMEKLDDFSRLLSSGYSLEDACARTGYNPTEKEIQSIMEVRRKW